MLICIEQFECSDISCGFIYFYTIQNSFEYEDHGYRESPLVKVTTFIVHGTQVDIDKDTIKLSNRI